ncbi:MAG: helix-turn-helix domain-containing protein [Desulfurellaceae bacterium]|nr:helix-turn-helix domain-containing protein [Desulfurellaceae bacterium]
MKKFIETFTVDEVARAVKLHPYTIRRLCRDGKIPAFKFGGQWRFDVKEIEKWGKNQGKRKWPKKR